MVAQPPPAPVIDPELAEMEAAAASRTTAEEVRAAGESITQRLLRTVLQKRESKGRPTQGPASVPKAKMSANRAVARAVKSREAPDRSRTPHARLGRAKPKKSQSQINWEFREAARQALSGIKLVSIQVHCPELKYVVGHPGVRTVWQLSQLDTATVHAIPGFGPKRRQAVAKYLREHQVPCKWVP